MESLEKVDLLIILRTTMSAEYDHEICQWETESHKCNTCHKKFKCLQWAYGSCEECICRNDVECSECNAASEKRIRQFDIANAAVAAIAAVAVVIEEEHQQEQQVANQDARHNERSILIDQLKAIQEQLRIIDQA